jgi:putative DNA primase/helicase
MARLGMSHTERLAHVAAQKARPANGVGAAITELRHRLLEAGFLPLPLHGKVPAFREWQKHTRTTRGDIDIWDAKYPLARNTGILTAYTPPLDIDILNPAAAQAVEDLVRERFEERGYILVRFGLAPKRAILFRTNEPFGKITASLIAPDGTDQKLELLADGQQIVVAGIHPDSKKPYTWHGGEPGQINREDLPYISEEEAQALVADCVELLVTKYGYRRPGGHHCDNPRKTRESNGQDTAAPDWSAAEEQRVRDALTFIPADDRDVWLRVGMALHWSGWKTAREIWNAWSQTCPDKFDSADQPKVWNSFGQPRNGDPVTLATLFHLAREHGWSEGESRSGASVQIIEIAQYRKAKSSNSGNTVPPEKTTIRIVKGQIARITDEAEAALIAAANVAPIMARAGRLVQPIIDRLPATRGRMTDVVLLKPLTSANIVYLLNKYAADFERYDGREKTWVKADPPPAVATQLLEKGHWKFPKVAGVITTPTLRPDGTILNQPGYDPATQLWFAPDSSLLMPELTENPTREQAEQAMQRLEDLLTGFPFADALDRSVALAAALTPILRGAFDVAPMGLFRAHDVGSGKSYLADLISYIARGQPCPVITSTKSVEEMEKRLGALVLEGAPMISLDNCSFDIGGDLLCQITERRLIRIRILGKSEAPECEWRGTLLGTGNNITLVGDMTRRGLLLELNAKVERPELREFAFDPVERALADRGTYVAAAITIARAYLAAGSPPVCGPLGSYGDWSRIVRSPLVWLNRKDPVQSMDHTREDDPMRKAVNALITLWRDNLPPNVSYTAAELAKLANKKSERDELLQPDLHDLLLQQAGTTRGDIDTRKVSSWLVSIRGRVHGGHSIERVKESRGHGNRYALVKVK